MKQVTLSKYCGCLHQNIPEERFEWNGCYRTVSLRRKNLSCFNFKCLMYESSVFPQGRFLWVFLAISDPRNFRNAIFEVFLFFCDKISIRFKWGPCVYFFYLTRKQYLSCRQGDNLFRRAYLFIVVPNWSLCDLFLKWRMATVRTWSIFSSKGNCTWTASHTHTHTYRRGSFIV